MSGFEFDIALIQQVEQFKHIYDKKQKLYKDKIAVMNAWESIGDILKISSSECQHRWETIRNRYSKEKRAPASGSSGGAKKEWPCMSALHFLQDVVSTRKKFGNFSNYQNETLSLSENITFDYISENSEFNELHEDESTEFESTEPKKKRMSSLSEASTSNEPPVLTTTFVSTPVIPNQQHIRPKKTDSNLEMQLTSTASSLNDFLAKKNASNNNHDSDMMFCISMYESLKCIKRKTDKNKAKIAILNAIQEFIED